MAFANILHMQSWHLDWAVCEIKLLKDLMHFALHSLYECVHACTCVRHGCNVYLSLVQVSMGAPGPWSREKCCFSGEYASHTNKT